MNKYRVKIANMQHAEDDEQFDDLASAETYARDWSASDDSIWCIIDNETDQIISLWFWSDPFDARWTE